MLVSSEVEVDVRHGQNKGVPSSSGTALYSENGAQRWLPKAHYGLFSHQTKRLTKAYGGRSLSFPGLGWSDCCHYDDLSVRFVFQPLMDIQRDFGLVLSVLLYLVL